MSPSSYQPFLIGQGQSKTGFFQYYQSWIAPEDAFDDIQDAYINRGVINKRDGQTLLGVLTYCSSEVLAYGNGGKTYSGTITSHLPILAGSVTLMTRNTSGNTETYTDNGNATLTGNLGGTATLVYATGVWTLNSAVNLTDGRPIMIDYTFTPTSATNPGYNQSVVGKGDGDAGAHSGVFSFNLPIKPNTVILIAYESSGTEIYTDNGAGVLTGNLGGTGTINYSTGAWSFTPSGGATVVSGSPIQLGFVSINSTFTIMGINQWNDEANNTFLLVVEDTRRASVYNVTSQTFQPLCTVAETLFILDGMTTTFDNGPNNVAGISPTFNRIAPLSITVILVNTLTGVTQDTSMDNGAGSFSTGTPNGFITNASTINYLTGEFSIVLDAAHTQGWAINVTFELQNDYFTGNQSNFFNWTNWEPATNQIVTQARNGEDPTQFHRGFLYLTNNVDPITLFDGVNLSRPAFAIQQQYLGLGLNQISRCLDVKTFASRLLFVRPTTTISDGNPDPQSIRWSTQFQPTNTVADIPGSGGELSAATSDWIYSAKFLKDFIVVDMQNSNWTFRFTGSAFAPFQFFRLNSTKNCSAPYGSIEYDDQVTSMGTKGLCACDGNAKDRYDWKIIDQFESIASNYFIQCFGQRFDILNQAWMLYPDISENATLSNKVLLYNYVEDSWAKFNMTLSCLGLGFGIKDMTWSDFSAITWDSLSDVPWNSYLEQTESLRLLGGDFNGNVLQLNDGATDNGALILMNLTTKKYNPFAKDGLRGQFGYVDVYYTVNPEITLTYNFFIDNNTDIAFTRKIALTGASANSAYGWQRLFINVQAQQIQWQIQDNGVSGFQILGHILWARPAGRITQ